jgi:hypothetical protein
MIHLPNGVLRSSGRGVSAKVPLPQQEKQQQYLSLSLELVMATTASHATTADTTSAVPKATRARYLAAETVFFHRGRRRCSQDLLRMRLMKSWWKAYTTSPLSDT